MSEMEDTTKETIEFPEGMEGVVEKVRDEMSPNLADYIVAIYKHGLAKGSLDALKLLLEDEDETTEDEVK